MQQHTRHLTDLHGLTGNGIRFAGGFGRIVFPFGARHHKCGGATESRGTAGLRNVGDLGEQQRVVGLVIAMPAGPAGRQDARSVAHYVHDQAGVVGDCRAAGTCGHITGLEQRVLLKGHAIFHGIGQVQRACGDELRIGCAGAKPFLQNAAYFHQLALIVGGDDDFHGFLSVCALINDQGSINPRRVRHAVRPAAPCCPVRRDRAGR